MKKKNNPVCPKCNFIMKQRYNKNTQKIYFCCANKQCDMTITAHPDGSPVGSPVCREVRELRTLAHRLADRIWKYKNFKQRQKMYSWLKNHSIEGHFGMMKENALIEIIDKLQKIIKKFKK